MSWVQLARGSLRKGETVQVKPRGHSMRGRVNDGDIVTLDPVAAEALAVGDIVLVRVHGRDCLHLVKAIHRGRFQIGNNRGGINGWVGPNGIYGRAIKVEAPAPS